MRSLIVSIVVLPACLLMATDAFADCSSNEKSQMRAGGLTESRIHQICDEVDTSRAVGRAGSVAQPRARLGSQGVTPQFSNICQTQYMWCAIGRQGPVGFACWCNSAYGPINGMLIAPR